MYTKNHKFNVTYICNGIITVVALYRHNEYEVIEDMKEYEPHCKTLDIEETDITIDY